MDRGSFKWTYELATGRFVCGGPYDPPCDPATQGIERYRENPDPRTERYDATAPNKKRPATAEEIAAYDAAQKDAEADALVNQDKRLLVLAEWCRQELNTVRAALPVPLPPITRVQALAALRTISRTL